MQVNIQLEDIKRHDSDRTEANLFLMNVFKYTAQGYKETAYTNAISFLVYA